MSPAHSLLGLRRTGLIGRTGRIGRIGGIGLRRVVGDIPLRVVGCIGLLRAVDVLAGGSLRTITRPRSEHDIASV